VFGLSLINFSACHSLVIQACHSSTDPEHESFGPPHESFGRRLFGKEFGEVGNFGGELLSFPAGKRKTTKRVDRICTPLAQPPEPAFLTREFGGHSG
jgi:hypothetical protein